MVNPTHFLAHQRLTLNWSPALTARCRVLPAPGTSPPCPQVLPLLLTVHGSDRALFWVPTSTIEKMKGKQQELDRYWQISMQMNVSLRASRFKTYKNNPHSLEYVRPVAASLSAPGTSPPCLRFAPIVDRTQLGSGVVLSSQIYRWENKWEEEGLDRYWQMTMQITVSACAARFKTYKNNHL